MSEMKLSLLDQRIAQFCENTSVLLTDINARNNSEKKGKSNGKRKMQITIPIPDLDMDFIDEEHFGL